MVVLAQQFWEKKVELEEWLESGLGTDLDDGAPGADDVVGEELLPLLDPLLPMAC